jgi:outer membrane protein assembly factor BamB
MGRRTTALVVALLATFGLAGCDWAGLQFGPANTNFNPYEPELNASSVRNLDVAWSAPCACRDRALVAAATVFAVTGYGDTETSALTLRAFDAASGAPKWSTPLGTVERATLSAVGNGLAYVLVVPASGSDRILAFDTATGVRRWRLTPPEPGTDPVSLSTPIVDGPLLFVIARVPTRSDVFAIDTSGRVAWSAAPAGYVTALTADPDSKRLYAVSALTLTAGPPFGFQFLTGYEEADGSVRSSVVTQLRHFVGVGTLGFSNELVIGTQPNLHAEGGVGAFALHPDTGAFAWTGNGGLVEAITPSVTFEHNFRQSPSTVARDTSTGAVLWQADFFPEAVAGDLAYGAGEVRRLSDGALVTTLNASGGLTPANGRLYAAGAQLQAFVPA